MKKIVILTNRYPYYPGESFFDTELKTIACQFEEIDIVSVNGTGKRRETLDRAIVHQLSGNVGYLQLVAAFFRDRQARKWLKSDLGRAKRKGWKAPFILINWLGRAVLIRNYIQKQFKCLDDRLFYSYWLTPSALALALLKETNPKMTAVSRAHGGDLYETRHSPPYLPLQQKMIETLDLIFPISEDGKNHLMEQYPDKKEKLKVSRLGTIDPGFLARRSDDGIFRIVTCSYIKPVKRLELLVDALKEIEIKAHWTHIGDGPHRAQLEEKAKNLLPPHVSYRFTGALTNEEIYAFYEKEPVDVFINVSSSEGIPVTIMEAFSSGIPAIATNVGGVKELVTEENGMLLAPDLTPKQLAEAIGGFAKLSVQEKQHYSKKAYETWKEYYYAKKNYTDFITGLKNWSHQEHE
ncbi:glycosyltransferase [Fictibacillus gelatini]|uniref:glycosyltransferase n=1 Tax=Fictibacillus gelatini TaxID=225985 RepID=UPI0012B65612|nr:glycosyltransferase [Fictibacillus gelatini]